MNTKDDPEDDREIRDEESENVKSTAVVKYSVPKPARFTKLQCNTDLNLPPSNWLSSAADSYGLQHVLYQPKGFPSFRMAHMFPDCVGEVDVVSDSENIKKLLKIPYHKGCISMVVHRVENTLLLDDFDIYKYILQTAKSEWEWLRKFFCENIERDVVNEERTLYIKNKKQKALKQKSLVSKFLYHSLVQSENDEACGGAITTSRDSLQGPILPEPSASQKVPDPSTFSQPYNRNVVWTFEDIDMLIGTDMPIFGGGTHPCISLRLSDMNKPINVLTGIDYWLDNLMSNVPEVVMCYHLNGIVQKYELIKTEDLPSMDNSKFSPKLIRDVAQNILSFLKSNATKAGHTYWLFKGKDEEVIKLYDLTSLCSSEMFDNDQNPFTVPVAMLLYKVARNMRNSSDRKQPGTVRMLLKNCIKLLAEEKYPEIVTSSHYMLADLYIPARTNPDNPDFDLTDTEDSESVYDDDPHDDCEECATKVLILNNQNLNEKFTNCYKPPPPIAGSIEDRCMQSILHVAAGLDCIKYFHKEDSKSKGEENLPFAKSNVPIPMPYSKLDKSDKLDVKKKGKKKKKGHQKDQSLLPKTSENTPPEDITWKDHLKSLLYQKAILVLATLAERNYSTGNYGSCMRCIGILVRCVQILEVLKCKYSTVQGGCLLGRAGDCCIRIVQNWQDQEEFNKQLHAAPEEDLKILEQIEQDEQMYEIHLIDSPMKCVLIYEIRTVEQMLLNGVACYEVAMTLCDGSDIQRRLGNALNELGTLYLRKARSLGPDDTNSVVEICKVAELYLKRALDIFESTKDEANSALLHSNMGHLFRLVAHIVGPKQRAALTGSEKYYYNKAFESYKKALQVIGERKHLPVIWDIVTWELCGAYFTMATILQDYPSGNLTLSEAEKEVIETLKKSLQYCDHGTPQETRLHLMRAGVIHSRMATLYHSSIWRSTCSDTSRKTNFQLAKINYEKSAKFYCKALAIEEYFRMQLQLVALQELQAENITSAQSKYKHYKTALDVLISTREMLVPIIDREIEIDEEEIKNFAEKKKYDVYETPGALLIFVKTKLQALLRQLLKVCLSQPPINKQSDKMAEVYKSSYGFTFQLEGCNDIYKFTGILNEILGKIEAELMPIKNVMQ